MSTPGLSGEVLLAPLNRPSHYLKPRDGRPPLDKWLNPRMLYRIPRSQVTTGVRALGRLAFCDHYRAIVHRLQVELEACLESSDVPYVIYRLSTLVGDSKTGFTSHFTTPHQALRVMHLGLASLVPGLPDYSVDLIPTDWAGAAIVNHFLNEFQAGQVVHLVAGAARSYSLAQVIDESYDRLGELDPAWKGRHYPKPAIATQAAFQLLVRSAEQARDPLMIGVLGMLKYFTEQFSYPKDFDTRGLNGANAAPDIREYYGRVVAYWCAS